MKDLKTHSFFTLGLVAHIIAILFVSLYSVMGDETNKAFRIDAMETEFDRDMTFTFISVFTLIMLFISYSLELTWPMRIEETLIIILVWSLLGNLSVGYIHQEVPCDIHGEPVHEHYHSDVMTVTTEHDENPPPPPPLYHESVENETIISVATVVVHKTTGATTPKYNAASTMIKSHCGWSLFNIYFSILCVISPFVSFLCDTKNYYLSFIFRGISVTLTILIFLVPIACNRFKLMSVEVLILKITLYNIAWNMNRFKRITEGLIGDNYSKGITIIKSFITTHPVVPTRNNLTSRRRLQQQQQQRQRQLRNKKKRRGDDSESEDESSSSSSEESDESESDDEMRGLTLRQTKSPQIIFQQIDNISADIKKRNKKQERQQIPQQINNFESLSKTNRKYRAGCLFSWKYRSYNNAIIYLIDISRTAWILAICPIYLFIVVLLLLWLAYYIRINIKELEATSNTISIMSVLYKKRNDPVPITNNNVMPLIGGN